MPTVLQSLQFAAQGLDFITAAQLEHRAGLVEADFKEVGLQHRITCQKIPVPGWRGMLPYASYQLLGSQCDIDQAVSGDRRHTSMSGGGLDRECLLYYSKVAEWAHAYIPHLWCGKFRAELRDPNSHLDTVCEAWWLSRVVGADFKSALHGVPADPGKTGGKNFDWQLRLPSAGVTLNLEVKRRPGDIGRFIDQPKLKWKTIFNDLDKFPPPAPPDVINVGCIRLFAPISREVIEAANEWLKATTNVSALAFHAPSRTTRESFAVITQPGLGYIEHFFAPPDREDNTYVSPFWFGRNVPGLPRP